MLALWQLLLFYKFVKIILAEISFILEPLAKVFFVVRQAHHERKN